MKKPFALLHHNTINCLLEAPLHIGHPFIGKNIHLNITPPPSTPHSVQRKYFLMVWG